MDNLERIALMIDADNTQLSKMESVIREISKYGRIVVKRAYGNWKKDTLKNWEDEVKRLAIKAEQQFDYVSGKNATDMALVIDTIELMHEKIYDGFVLVSSDSDYTPLAIRLREYGIYVMGVGAKTTPEAFRNACDEFVFLENLNKNEKETKRQETRRQKTEKKTQEKQSAETASDRAEAAGEEEEERASLEEETDVSAADWEELHKLLRIAADTYEDSDGYVNVSAAGTFIKRAKPDFDARTYGFRKLPQLLEAFPDRYEMKRYPGKGTVTIVAYRCR